MKLASLRSRMRCKLLCTWIRHAYEEQVRLRVESAHRRNRLTWVGSTSPWMMFRMEIYLL